MKQDTIIQNLSIFKELINCNANIYFWHYNGSCSLLESNGPFTSVLSTVFSAFCDLEKLYDYGTTHDTPAWIGSPLGLNWLADFHKENNTIENVYIIGPVFLADISLHTMNSIIKNSPQLNFDTASKRELLKILETIPTISATLWNQYAIMLHYCITGRSVNITDIGVLNEIDLFSNIHQTPQNRQKIWITEQNILRIVREGILDYQTAFSQASLLSDGIPLSSTDPLRKAKDSVIILVSLCARASVDGGLTPEQAYGLADIYIQKAEDATHLEDLANINNTMLEDFVLRVHKLKNKPFVSKQIQTCCDYIETHCEEILSLESLAQMIGYSKYYLSRKFNEEVGTSINNYIKIARINRAKTLLATTDKSILEIAEQLHFCSRSHFSETFQKIEKCTPVEYRGNTW